MGQRKSLSWAALAAVDYRESGNAPDRSALAGEPLGSPNPDHPEVSTSTKEDSLERAADYLRGLASSVYGVDLAPTSGAEDMRLAFLAYNRGSIYREAGVAARPTTPRTKPTSPSRPERREQTMLLAETDYWGPYRSTVEERLACCEDHLGRLRRSLRTSTIPTWSSSRRMITSPGWGRSAAPRSLQMPLALSHACIPETPGTRQPPSTPPRGRRRLSPPAR